MSAATAGKGADDQRLVRVSTGVGGRSTQFAVHETGSGQHDCIVVFVHGVVSDSRAWRLIGRELQGSFDTMAIDLPGCGSSACPDPRKEGDAAYTPDALAEVVLCVLRQRLSERTKPARIVLVGHSLGGLIVLRMFGCDALRREYYDELARVLSRSCSSHRRMSRSSVIRRRWRRYGIPRSSPGELRASPACFEPTSRTL